MTPVSKLKVSELDVWVSNREKDKVGLNWLSLVFLEEETAAIPVISGVKSNYGKEVVRVSKNYILISNQRVPFFVTLIRVCVLSHLL